MNHLSATKLADVPLFADLDEEARGEIAAAFAFLASDDAKFINGTVLSVDGACTI